jgi:hypothetical protein
MLDDFTDHPVSISEARASKEHDSRLWTPRDALINLLRDIDSGKVAPDALVCVYRATDEDGDLCTRYLNATQDIDIAVGLLARGQSLLMRR